jgi:hypothetical protein
MAGRNRIPMTSGVGVAGSSDIIVKECNKCEYNDKVFILTCAECRGEKWMLESDLEGYWEAIKEARKNELPNLHNSN